MASHSALITIMTNAARKASTLVKRDYGEVEQLQVSKKGPSDFVTNADIRTEHILREELGRARPNFGFLTEESGVTEGSDPSRRWIIDPIDGTTNFIHGIGHFAICIALEESNKITAGVIFDPINEQMFWAEKGFGAYLNNRRIRVSARTDLSNSIFATGIPFRGRGTKSHHKEFLQELAKIMSISAGIRRFGSAALDLAYVAAGKFDGFWEAGLSPWDIAAGILIVREAGGMVSDKSGKDGMMETGTIIAANPELHGLLCQILNSKN
ncbi:MAG: inositol monophosphatase family protein [Pseudomonadota bacterium]|nr:inositol monophosphatase family protein [Pseudomonadota bacterium]